MNIVALKHLWWGVSIGGKHYTGEIVRYPEPTVELTRKLSRKEAKVLAKQDGCPIWPLEINRFDSLEQLERYAAKWCKENLGDDWLLLEYDWNNPNRAIAGQGYYKKVMPGINELARWWWLLTDSQREQIWSIIYKVWADLLKKP